MRGQMVTTMYNNNRYGDAPRAWKEIGSLSNYDADDDNLKKHWQ